MAVKRGVSKSGMLRCKLPLTAGAKNFSFCHTKSEIPRHTCSTHQNGNLVADFFDRDYVPSYPSFAVTLMSELLSNGQFGAFQFGGQTDNC